MSIRLQRLLRMRRAFESVGKIHELKRLSLARERIATEVAIGEICSALDFPYLDALPLRGVALRRVAEARARIAALESEIASHDRKAVAAKSVENHSADLHRLLKAAEDRDAAEQENLETVGAMMSSSLWQESDG